MDGEGGESGGAAVQEPGDIMDDISQGCFGSLLLFISLLGSTFLATLLLIFALK